MAWFRVSFLLFLSLIFVSVAAGDPAQDPYTCSADRPCKIGCCSKTGVCGLGPKFCGADVCQSSCHAKSDCDPGWGSEWSSKETCPLNVCCSDFGFCGTTKDFCGNKTVPQPSCGGGGNSAAKRVIGYYESWSSSRACGGMFPEDLLYSQYTHLNYAFAFVDPVSFALAPMSESDKTLWPRFTALKKQNPALETWISVGGWSMNDADQPTAKTFSQLAASSDAQSKFFASLVNFMSTYGFDGVDVDWEYPVAPERSGSPADYENYVSFLRNLRSALGSGGHKYGLTITIPSSYWYMQNFDMVALAAQVDWFNVMTYDLHGTWDSTSPWIGPVINAHTNLTEIQNTMDLLWRNKIDPDKVVMGMGFYGRSFTLSEPACKDAGCPFSAGGSPGSCTASAGTLSYAEIQDIISDSSQGATVREDKDAGAALVTWGGNQWVSYDNANTLKKKMDFANAKCLGGVMVWAASTDDSSGTAIQALNAAAGRTDLSQKALSEKSRWGSTPTGQCVWGECDQDCPSGFSAATGSGGKTSGYAGIFNGCNNGKSRYYCCPTGTDPKCEWKGSAVFCGATSGGRCSGDQVEVTTDTSGGGHTCWTGHKSLCCSKSTGDADIGKCAWSGSAPFCTTASAALLGSSVAFWSSADCPKDKPEKITKGKQGAGGEQPCLYNGGWKSFCCSDPSPYDTEKCAWHQGRSAAWTEWAESLLFQGPLGFVYSGASKLLGQDCAGQCPDGQIPIATDGTNCQPGTYSYYCCPNPNAPALPAPADAVCAPPASLPFRNKEPDPDSPSDRDAFSESHFFDDDCTDYTSATAHTPRPRFVMDAPANSTEVLLLLLDPRAALERRTRASKGLLKYCTNGQTGSLTPQTYSGYRTVASLAGKGWIHIGKPLACGAVGVVVTLTEPVGQLIDWVVEHVYEKQSLRNHLQSMASGYLANGQRISVGAAPNGVLNVAGFFFQTWTTAGNYGNSPEDTAFGVLGHTGNDGAAMDVANLQVVDADLNALKAAISAYHDFGPDATWNSFNPKTKVSFLSDVIDVFQYMQLAQTTGSYKAAFKAMLAFWKVFNSAASAAGYPQYDYAKAYTEVVNADLQRQIDVALPRFQTLLKDATSKWNSLKGKNIYSDSEVDDNLKALAGFAAQVKDYIKYDVKAMTG